MSLAGLNNKVSEETQDAHLPFDENRGGQDIMRYSGIVNKPLPRRYEYAMVVVSREFKIKKLHIGLGGYGYRSVIPAAHEGESINALGDDGWMIAAELTSHYVMRPSTDMAFLIQREV